MSSQQVTITRNTADSSSSTSKAPVLFSCYFSSRHFRSEANFFASNTNDSSSRLQKGCVINHAHLLLTSWNPCTLSGKTFERLPILIRFCDLQPTECHRNSRSTSPIKIGLPIKKNYGVQLFANNLGAALEGEFYIEDTRSLGTETSRSTTFFR